MTAKKLRNRAALVVCLGALGLFTAPKKASAATMACTQCINESDCIWGASLYCYLGCGGMGSNATCGGGAEGMGFCDPPNLWLDCGYIE
jgi:hypothetical protein